MRTVTVRQWLKDEGLESEIISQKHLDRPDRLSDKGMKLIRTPEYMKNVIRANNARVHHGEYIYLTPIACYHSVTLKK